MTDEVLQQLANEARELRETVTAHAGTGGAATITINAGGAASIAACMIAAVCMVVMIALAFQQQKTDTRQDADIREMRAEQRRDGDYRNLLYRNYPELRPEILKKHEAENH